MAELIVRKQAAVGTIVLSNPEKYNAMSFDMWNALPDTMAQLDADPTIRLVVLEGDGEKAFVSGSDVSQFDKQRTGEQAIIRYNNAVEQAHLAAGRCSKPVIAKIKGVCIGGGVGLAASCDVRLCCADARFRIPAARIGLGYPTVAIAKLLPLVGPQNLLEILLSARYFDANDALRMGLVSHVWSATDFVPQCDQWLQQVAENAPLTLRAIKQATQEMVNKPGVSPSLVTEAMIAACFSSNDYKEGTLAFSQGRVPKFEGH